MGRVSRWCRIAPLAVAAVWAIVPACSSGSATSDGGGGHAGVVSGGGDAGTAGAAGGGGVGGSADGGSDDDGSADGGSAGPIPCISPTDCADGLLCCLVFAPDGRSGTISCQPSCVPSDSTLVACTTNADCPAGVPTCTQIGQTPFGDPVSACR
jgi:hypothetical protein